jgi:hypothetical protein
VEEEERGNKIAGWDQHRVWIWQSIERVYQEIGDELFCWAYCMTYPTFLELHRLLEPEILRIHKEYLVLNH